MALAAVPGVAPGDRSVVDALVEAVAALEEVTERNKHPDGNEILSYLPVGTRDACRGL